MNTGGGGFEGRHVRTSLSSRRRTRRSTRRRAVNQRRDPRSAVESRAAPLILKTLGGRGCSTGQPAALKREGSPIAASLRRETGRGCPTPASWPAALSREAARFDTCQPAAPKTDGAARFHSCQPAAQNRDGAVEGDRGGQDIRCDA